MFDRAIIDTDRFMDLPMSTKALYFLLGMEADDEGFVSYKKVLRIHGGNEDDIKILSVKNFIIPFDSGVIVIVDWNKNNYLDKNRITPTEYQKERQMISLTDTNNYVLNNCLTEVKSIENKGDITENDVLTDNEKDELNKCSTSIEENSIEQSRREESTLRISTEIHTPTPKEIAKSFFKGVADLVDKVDSEDSLRVKNLLNSIVTKTGCDKKLLWDEIKKFEQYWTELNKTGKQQRWEKQATFMVDRRINKWLSNKEGFIKKNKVQDIEQF